MFGDVAPQDLVRSDGARAGDILILTKGIAVEGTAILARDLRDRLCDALDPELLDRASLFLHNPGLSVVKDAMIATSAGEIHAMHDPTEGGVATGIHELSEASGLGADINADALPVYPETLAICDVLGLDPLGVIASGSLLMAAAPRRASAVIEALQAQGIAATAIGVLRRTPGVALYDGNGRRPLRKFARDEIAKLFETPVAARAATEGEHDAPPLPL